MSDLQMFKAVYNGKRRLFTFYQLNFEPIHHSFKWA
jgi:hypothetical protein